ncbi:glycosyltransferase family 2 protein [Nostoc sp.]|uniref:glycosyltransferase family 2 protein n=1 Tax=Nostoc sp. TaxID=1180 RepID=UPI002FF88A95
MNKQQSNPANILPVLEGITRPLWSVMIPTYNCAEQLRETLASVLSQDPGTEVMQIEVIDDCSTKDDPEAVVAELGRGRVGFYRQPQNLGYINNFNTCLQRSRGKLIHLLHGDDCVLDSFYDKMHSLFEKYPNIGAAFCRHIFMDQQSHWQYISSLEQLESGILNNWLEQIASGQRLTTPSIVVQREVYEKLGGFDSRFSWTGEDWEMWVRIATKYSVGYEVKPLAAYRIASLGSLTQVSTSSGKFFHDLRLADEIIQSYLPNYIEQSVAIKASKQARETYGSWAVMKANQIIKNGDIKTLIILIQEALKCSDSPNIVRQIIRLMMKIGVYKIKQVVQVAR